MINILVFSKDRAMQLDLLLKSIQKNFHTENKIDVLVLSTDQIYERGYEIIKQRYSHASLHKQWPNASFKDQVMAIVDLFDYDWTVCFLDDDVVINPVDLVPALEFITSDVNALSLRMHPGITTCYPKDMIMAMPDFQLCDNNLMKWNWAKYDPALDWGYPMSLGGNVYRHSYLKGIWEDIRFAAPNWMEGYMHMCRPIGWMPYQLAFTEQKVYNVANNLVQNVCDNRYEHNHNNSIEILNKKYLDGYEINLSKIEGRQYISANGPAEYKIIKREKRHGI